MGSSARRGVYGSGDPWEAAVLAPRRTSDWSAGGESQRAQARPLFARGLGDATSGFTDASEGSGGGGKAGSWRIRDARRSAWPHGNELQIVERTLDSSLFMGSFRKFGASADDQLDCKWG